MIPATSIADGAQAVLVIVDVQERLAAAMQERGRVLDRTKLLLAVAEIVEVPVVVTRQYPKGLGDTEPALVDTIERYQAEGLAVSQADKLCFNCFGEAAFTEVVCRTGRRQLLLAGMETHICIAQTALGALREGYDVHVVADACCSRDPEMHGLALQRLGNAGAVITTAESVAYELVSVAGTAEFKRLLAAVKG